LDTLADVEIPVPYWVVLYAVMSPITISDASKYGACLTETYASVNLYDAEPVVANRAIEVDGNRYV
jgi:hypothetical protein